MLLNKTNKVISCKVLPDIECGSHEGSGTMDMVFGLCEMQEKWEEQNMPLYAVYIDFTEALDTASRKDIWLVLRKLGCITKMVNLIRSLHNGMQTHVFKQN